MHQWVLSELMSVLIVPLFITFQTSVSTSHLPAAWKGATISAIHKKGNKHIVGNYRPVSLISMVNFDSLQQSKFVKDIVFPGVSAGYLEEIHILIIVSFFSLMI